MSREREKASTINYTLIIDSISNEFPQRHRTFASGWKCSSISPLTFTLLLSDTPGALDAKSVAPDTCIFLGIQKMHVCQRGERGKRKELKHAIWADKVLLTIEVQLNSK